MYKHILIATDGSEESQKCVGHGFGLAKMLGSGVTVVTVTEPLPLYGNGLGTGRIDHGMMAEAYRESQDQTAAAILEAAKEEAARCGVEIEALHIPERSVAPALLEAVEARNCDLVVMGSQGRRGISRLVLGSTSAEVVSSANVPVLIVR